MKLLSYGKDGGQDSTVWGFWLVEIKALFSVAVLCFEDGSRDAYHSHAFNSVSWVLSGMLSENRKLPNGKLRIRLFEPSFKPIYTSRDNMHRVESAGRTWVLTFRGPWAKRWLEYWPASKQTAVLESGRRVVSTVGPLIYERHV